MPSSSSKVASSGKVATPVVAEPGPSAARSRRLEVVHRTRYTYGEPANRSINDLRVQPREGPWQDVEFYLLTVRPATQLTHFVDFHRNVVHHFEVAENHSGLSIESRSIVTTRCRYDMAAFPYGSSHAELAECRRMERCHEYLQPSYYVTLDPEIWRRAMEVRDSSEDVFQTSYEIMRYLHENFRYEAGATQVSTGAAEAFAHRHGVCQDFAHVGIAMCRTLGIPARYVSGYLFDPLHDHLRGTQASHAWFEVFVRGRGGWYGLDPTNNKVVDENYVTVAIGRDYQDVAPVEGAFFGGGAHRKMEVSVALRERA